MDARGALRQAAGPAARRAVLAAANAAVPGLSGYVRALKALAAGAGLLLVSLPLVVLAAAGGPPVEPSAAAAADIPGRLLGWYVAAAQVCPGLSWSVLAAVGKVESDHGRAGGARVSDDGDVSPWIIGVALDGAGATAVIVDSDAGRWDRDRVWDRAVGPLQFIPATWRAYGADGNRDGSTDPHNFADAAFAAAGYLCAHGGGDPARLRQAVLAYNHAGWYADQVLALAGRYAQAGPDAVAAAAGIVCPVPGATFTDTWGAPRSGGRTHQGQDLFAPEGTPIVAVADGVVWATSDADVGLGGISLWLRTDDDGAAWYFAHNLANAPGLAPGVPVAAGQVIAWVGRSGNARATPAHAHIQWRPTGAPPDVNPYRLLDAACPGH